MRTPVSVFSPLLMIAAGAALLTPTSAAAMHYVYSYTGNVFTVTTTNYLDAADPFHFTQGRTFSVNTIQARVVSDTLLTETTTLSDVRSFSMTLTDWGQPGSNEVIVMPMTPPCDCPLEPTITGDLRMSNFNILGQPMSWDMWIKSDTPWTSGRRHTLRLDSNNGRDMVGGGDEAYVGFEGALMYSAGVWDVTAVVPEPSTYALMLVGVGAVGLMARRRAGQASGSGPATSTPCSTSA